MAFGIGRGFKDLKVRAEAAQAQKTAKEDGVKKVGEDYVAERKISRDVLQGIAGHEVPGVTAAAVDPTFRNAQVQLLQQLTQRAQGQGPSIAQQQFQQAGNTALQKSMGAIRAATGTNAALGGRTAALASTNLLGNIAAESGMARLREQQDAQKMLGDLAGSGRLGDLQGRQQDINMGLSNAEIALKNAAVRQGAADRLLSDTFGRYEGHYERGNRGDIAKAAGSGKPSLEDQVLGTVLTTGGTVLASKYGSKK
jgi:hypothetical protein